MNGICVDGLLDVVAAPFLKLFERYGRDVGSRGASLTGMLHAACEAELSDRLEVRARPELIPRSLVVASREERSVPRGRILQSVVIGVGDRDPGPLMRTSDGADLNFGDFSLWLACTFRAEIAFDERNLPLLRRDALLGDLMGRDGRLRHWPKKLAKRDDVLAFAIELFEGGREYGEKEVNEAIGGFFDDHALLRRELVVAGLLRRTADGAKYWRGRRR